MSDEPRPEPGDRPEDDVHPGDDASDLGAPEPAADAVDRPAPPPQPPAERV
jgi:hypothetical protein